MPIASRELWTEVHGLLLGGLFIVAFTGGFVGLWTLRAGWVTAEGARRSARWLQIWTWNMAILAWLTVLLGTYVVYPWYRAKPPAGATGAALVQYPKYRLLADPHTADLHEFGMEWKEHVAWLAPMLATCVAFAVTRYRQAIAHDAAVRRALLTLYSLAFAAALVAGLLGALINKAAPVR